MSTCTKVYLRQKAISKGRISLFLDYYPAVRNPHTMKLTRREFLGLYIYAEPRNRAQQDYNNEIINLAELIRCRRQESVINRQFGFIDHHQQKEDFLEYFRKMCKKKHDKWLIVYRHFEKFVNEKCIFENVTVELCRKFREYLLTASNLHYPKRKISKNSAAGYWATFRGLLRIAYRDKLITENINEFLDRIDKDEVRREFLTQEELLQLASTPCEYDVLRRASLFSCLTGLRISDIENLIWDNIRFDPDLGYSICIRTQKTQNEATIPICTAAVELCGERSSGKVFKGLKRCMTKWPLKKWLKEAGITKNISFHCFRHTYATLQLAAGTDIYTVSKMLTHKQVSTTEIYAHLVDSKKLETIGKIRIKE